MARVPSKALLLLTALATTVSPISAIINGRPDKDGENAEYPAVGAIVFDDPDDGKPPLVDCTGTLIASNKVLTAAHCVDLDPTDGTKLLGRQFFSLSNDPVPVGTKEGDCNGCINIASIEFHPNWDNIQWLKGNDPGDLAILILEEHVEDVAPMEFGSPNDYEKRSLRIRARAPATRGKENFTVVGYGATRVEGGEKQDVEFLDKRMITDNNEYQNVNQLYLMTSQSQNQGGSCWGDSVCPPTLIHSQFKMNIF